MTQSTVWQYEQSNFDEKLKCINGWSTQTQGFSSGIKNDLHHFFAYETSSYITLVGDKNDFN